MLSAALDLQAYGFAVHPLHERDKRPWGNDWQSRRWSAAELAAHWAVHPAANVGMRCGSVGWVVLDLDGDEWLAWALRTFPVTPLRTVSGSGHGGHLVYRWPVGVPVPKRRLVVPGLPDSREDRSVKHCGGDLYGDGAQVVLPPSVHPSGGLYRWAAFKGELPSVESVPVFDLAWLPERPVAVQVPASLRLPAPAPAVEGKAYKRAAAWMAKRETAGEGNRSNLAFTTACGVLEFGVSSDDAWQLVGQWNAGNAPPLPVAELRTVFGSAERRVQGSGQIKPEKPRAAAPDLSAEWRAPGPVDDDRPFHDDGPVAAPRRLVLPVVGSKDNVQNTRALLDFYAVQVRYNLMRHALEVEVPVFKPNAERAANATLAWVENRAADHGLARKPILSHLVEMAREYHPALAWVQSRAWDGVDRVEALVDTLELAATAREPEFRRELVRRWLLGAAASILPEFEGVFAAQGVLVLQGAQGKGKTRWVRSLVPAASPWVLTGRRIDPSSKDSVQIATAVWLVELGELDATFRRADIAALKAFTTQESDTLRTAYDRREERIARRTVFVASVNEPEYLVDTTGNRRWWTLPIERCNADHGIDLQQLWAQLVQLAGAAGARWWLDDDESAILADLNSDHEPDDALQSEVRDTWGPALFDLGNPSEGLSLAEVARGLPSMEKKTPSPVETHRIVLALRLMGVRSHRLNRGRVYYVTKTAGATAVAAERPSGGAGRRDYRGDW